MKRCQRFDLKLILQFVNMAILGMATSQAMAASLSLSSVPLFLTNSGKPNVLMMMGNSNSMDESASGAAVGSAAATSKSEIARNAIKSVITNNAGGVNMGLLAYQQSASSLWYLHDSQYDVTYNPANYNATFSGARNSTMKAFRVPNPTSAGNFLYYNVDLPFYDTVNDGNAFCYSSTACTSPTKNFYGISGSGCVTPENATTGPWDSYSCYNTKTGTSDAAPGVSGAGYVTNILNGAFSPTDSDLGQGITDFGKRISWQYTSRAWFANTSPGMGYLHTPISLLNAAQVTALNTKLGTSQFASNRPTNPAFPLQNSGLSPLEGTVLTANNYFNGTALPATQGGPAAAIPNSCGKNFLVLLTDGLPSVTQAGVASANVTQNLADVTTQVTNLRSSAATVKTYMVGFALPYGVNPAQLDTIAAAGDTGTSYYATDATTLNSAFSNIFSDIAAQTGSASSVAVNSGSLNIGSRVYQAKFSSLDWSGQLLSIAVNMDGSLGATNWDAGQVINSQAATSRNILTYKPSTNMGVAFRWPAAPATPTPTELDTVQSTALNTSASSIVDGNGSARLDYLRGSSVNEGSAGLRFRARNTSKLGDIVNSAPNYVGAPSANYTDPTYASFRSSNQSRTPVIYVGANDGMLHGFNVANGSETIAYIPSSVYSNLTQLTSTGYSHRYFVDSSPSSADVYYSGGWHTALVSGMGGGGKGIFGLDVTDPTLFSEANAANLVNFEFPNSTTTAADANDVGFVSGQIPIVKLNNGEWAAIFGNGYNSTGTGQSTLFIVNIKTGALIKKISTGVGTVGTPNALANPIAIDTDGNQTADVVYAGDLQGNMWKFDISGAGSGSWGLAYKLYAAGQPITETPDVSKNPNSGFMVYFGTGKYLETSDISTLAINTFYGIWDKFNATVPNSDLVQQLVTGTTTDVGGTYRLVSQNSVDYTSGTPKKGWYINLPTTGERSVTDPTVRGGRIIFTTLIPSSGACSYGGSSWLMELDYLTGGKLTTPPLDTNGDGVVNMSDRIVAGLGLATISSAPAIVSGAPVAAGSGGGSPVKIDEYKYIDQSDGTVTKVKESASGAASRRTSWRQIPAK